jgi:hypothetical protein
VRRHVYPQAVVFSELAIYAKKKKNLERKKKTRITRAQYEFPVLSSRDCLMKESIFPTCTGDDGQRIYLIFSPSSILDLFRISDHNLLIEKGRHLKIPREKGFVRYAIKLKMNTIFFSLVIKILI